MHIYECKFCLKKIPNFSLGEDYWCIHCQLYSVVVDKEHHTVESETIRVGNYYLNFFNAYKEASVVESDDNGHRLIHNFQCPELTHELAVHWAEKLKKYVVFQ